MKTRKFAVELVMGDNKWEEVARVALSAHIIHGVSQYLDLKDANGDTLVTLTWKSTVRLREVK